VGQPSIYVESVLHDCPLERTGDGSYRLLLERREGEPLPVTVAGSCRKCTLDRSLFDLVFRRA
jgi:hypothetical protein